MSKHGDNLRLAVLEGVFEQHLSYRKLVGVYGIARESVSKWVREHRDGKLTIDMLRARGAVAPTISAQDVGVLQRRRFNFAPITERVRDAIYSDDLPEAVPAISVPLSTKSIDLLCQLAALGVYGKDAADVAARFIDAALVRLVESGTIH